MSLRVFSEWNWFYDFASFSTNTVTDINLDILFLMTKFEDWLLLCECEMTEQQRKEKRC